MHRRQIAGGKADQRVIGVERGHHHLAHLARAAPGRRCRGGRFRRSRLRRRSSPPSPGFRRRCCRGRRWHSIAGRRCRASAYSAPQAGKQRPAPDRGAGEAPARSPISSAAIEDHLQIVGRAGIGGACRCRRRRAPAVRSGRCRRAAPPPRPRAHPISKIIPAGRQVIAKAVLHDVARPDAAGMQEPAHPPPVMR